MMIYLLVSQLSVVQYNEIDSAGCLSDWKHSDLGCSFNDRANIGNRRADAVTKRENEMRGQKSYLPRFYGHRNTRFDNISQLDFAAERTTITKRL